MDLHLASCRSRILLAITILCSKNVLARKASGMAASRYTFDLVHLQPCATPGNSMKYLNYSQAMSSDGVVSLNGMGDIGRTAQRLTDIAIVAYKCRDGVSANTCEYFTRFTNNGDGCRLISSSIVPWASLLGRSQPPIKCPLQTGWYVITNGTIDVDAYARMYGVSTNNDVWKITISIKDEKHSPFVCVDAAVRIMKYASRG
ncbi:uncharacterized protein LOC113210423 [Frankliniella occidentalis]|uniref:Uncharacterized protein LOC113210423 n=1 Tax=Frankliniella occidentalis TaxID=133901 RepID=A0A9C6UA06_FRAOC|nr:uncharacterized protein LOC113210423 [Frankliniella occidentalis]